MKKKIIINKIITGGQSGVDRSALDFSIKHNIPHGGWCPKNRWAEDGRIPDKYNLTETVEESPKSRTYNNVMDSDATLIIFKRNKDEGTNKTIEFCIRNKKPYFEIDLRKNVEQSEFKEWAALNKIEILNIAGPRESNNPGIYNKISPLLEHLLFG